MWCSVMWQVWWRRRCSGFKGRSRRWRCQIRRCSCTMHRRWAMQCLYCCWSLGALTFCSTVVSSVHSRLICVSQYWQPCLGTAHCEERVLKFFPSADVPGSGPATLFPFRPSSLGWILANRMEVFRFIHANISVMCSLCCSGEKSLIHFTSCFWEGITSHYASGKGS